MLLVRGHEAQEELPGGSKGRCGTAIIGTLDRGTQDWRGLELPTDARGRGWVALRVEPIRTLPAGREQVDTEGDVADSPDEPAAGKDPAQPSRPRSRRSTTSRASAQSKPAAKPPAKKPTAKTPAKVTASTSPPKTAASPPTADAATSGPAVTAAAATAPPPVTPAAPPGPPAAVPPATATGAAPEPITPSNRWRRIGAWVLTVLAGIAVAAAVVGYWAHETLLDTDRFMAAVTPAVESDADKRVVAERLSDQVLEALDLDTRVAEALDRAGERMSEAIAEALDLTPEQASRMQRLNGGLQLLAGSIAGGLETRIRDAINDFVASREGNGLLVDLVAGLHQRLVHLLRDELDQLPSIDVESGEVKLNLVPMVAESIRRVVNAGIVTIGSERQIPPFDSTEDAEAAIDRLASVVGRDLPPEFGQVALMSEDQLRNAQGLVQTFDRLVWLLIVLAVVLAVGAVLLAPTWTTGLLRVGVAVSVAVLIGWWAVRAISDAVAQAGRTPDGQVAIADVTSAVVHSLQPLAALLIVVGLVVAVGAFAFDRRAADVAA